MSLSASELPVPSSLSSGNRKRPSSCLLKSSRTNLLGSMSFIMFLLACSLRSSQVKAFMQNHLRSTVVKGISLKSKLQPSSTMIRVSRSQRQQEETQATSSTGTLQQETSSSSALIEDESSDSMKDSGIMEFLTEKVGKIDEDRLVFPELNNGEVPRLFSSLQYTPQQEDDGRNVRLQAVHAAGSTLGAAALVAGTTVGAGVLALPSATASAGFLPSTVAMLVAWGYMTMSGLLIAELSLNRFGATGRPGLGLLDLFESTLGKPWSLIGSASYFFLHYAVMVAYIAQGGTNLDQWLQRAVEAPALVSASSLSSSVLEQMMAFPGIGQIFTAMFCATALYTAKASTVETINNGLVVGVFASFLGIVALGVGTADFASLLDPANQHPDQVVNTFPILFLALVFQNIVPTIVTQLEGDRRKIITAIVAGTTLPLIMFIAWNAVILGNVAAVGAGLGNEMNTDPVVLLQQSAGGDGALLGTLVSGFSELALITSLIGFVYGLLDAWTDVFGISTKGSEYERYKPLLFAAVFGPPLAMSVGNPDIFYNALEYGGAFGVSTLFLVLPPIMVWQQRYGEDKQPLMTKPMVPLGKIPLASMWKAAGTLILEQGAEKLGLVDYIRDHFEMLLS